MVVPGFATILTVGVIVPATLMIIVLDVAGLPVTHPPRLDAISQATASPFVQVLYVSVALFVPTVLPFTFQVYVGEGPPLVGVAVNITVEVGQTVVEMFDVIETLTGKVLPVTEAIILFDVTGLFAAQVLLELTMQYITSRSLGVVVKTGLFVPVVAPLSFHVYVGVVPPLVAVAV